MKKSKRVVPVILSLALGMSMITGCGKKSEETTSFKNADDMISKLSKCCTLGEYKDMEYEEQVTEVTDDDIQSEIDSLLEQYTTTEYVTDGVAEDGDTVNIDYVGSIDGTEFEGGSTDGSGTDLELGSGTYIDGFEEQIVGHKCGETFDVNVTFPDDYSSTDLAGQDAVFETTLNSIAVKTVPEYNDAFVAENTEYDTVADYEQSVKEDLTESNAETDATANKSTLVTMVVDNATVDKYPEQYTESLIDEVITSVESSASSYGYDLATYVTAVYGMSSEQDFRDYVSEQVEDKVKEMVVICAIAKAEGITASNDEVQDYKQSLVTKYGLSSTSELDEYYSSDDYIYGALAEKVSDFLLANNTAVPEGTLSSETDATATDAE